MNVDSNVDFVLLYPGVEAQNLKMLALRRTRMLWYEWSSASFSTATSLLCKMFRCLRQMNELVVIYPNYSQHWVLRLWVKRQSGLSDQKRCDRPFLVLHNNLAFSDLKFRALYSEKATVEVVIPSELSQDLGKNCFYRPTGR